MGFLQTMKDAEAGNKIQQTLRDYLQVDQARQEGAMQRDADRMLEQAARVGIPTGLAVKALEGGYYNGDVVKAVDDMMLDARVHSGTVPPADSPVVPQGAVGASGLGEYLNRDGYPAGVRG